MHLRKLVQLHLGYGPAVVVVVVQVHLSHELASPVGLWERGELCVEAHTHIHEYM